MKKRTREEYRALNNEYGAITKKIEVAIDGLTEHYRNFFNNKDIDRLNALYDDIISIDNQFMYGKDPEINVKFKSTGDTLEAVNKVYMLIYEFFPFFNIEWINALLESKLDYIISCQDALYYNIGVQNVSKNSDNERINYESKNS